MRNVSKMILMMLMTFSISISAEPYDWCNSKFINCDKQYNETARIYTEKNPYEPGLRHTNTRGDVWYTKPNPYNNKQLRTRRIH